MIQIQIIPIYPKPRDYPANIIGVMNKAIVSALQVGVRPLLQTQMNARTVNWKQRPSMGASLRISHGGILSAESADFILTVFPTGPRKVVLKWMWVSLGTKAHPIMARRAPLLRFQEKYKPHTRARGYYGLAGGGTYYGDWVSKKSVVNPGIKPRLFEYWIKQKYERQIVRLVVNAIIRSVERA